MTRQLAQLLTGSLILWAVLAAPAWYFGGGRALLETLVACALCLVPMTLTMIWCHRAFRTSPEQQLAAALGGTGLRMLFVIGAGIALYHNVEELNRAAFLLWVVAFYLCTLTLEVVLIVRRQNAALARAPLANAPVAALPAGRESTVGA
jgi:hypothetical protein